MNCRNCGKEIDPNAAICVKCGAIPMSGRNHCQNCGAESGPGAVVCTKCGVQLQVQPVAYGMTGGKSKMAAGLLGIFLGGFGVHNFYLGYTGKAVAQLCLTIVGILTACLFIGILPIMGAYVWGLIEGIMILTGSINTDASGQPLQD